MNKFNTSQLITDNIYNENINEDNELVYKKRIKKQKLYKRVNNNDTIPDSRILAFTIGVCLGIVFFYLILGYDENTNFFKQILGEKDILYLKDYHVNKAVLLEYVLETRISQFLVVILCSVSIIGGVFAYLLLAILGMGFGIISFMSVYQYGVIGLLFAIMLFFPHGIFYSIIFFEMFKKHWFVNKKNYHNIDVDICLKKRKIINMIKSMVIILILFCFGILSETYINTEILKKIVVFLE